MLKIKKGIVLCGGEGTRLRPLTLITNKHLLPIYDKPMVNYPLETMKALGIEDVLLVSGGENIGHFTKYLGDGSSLGINLTYKVQKGSGGIAEALGLAREFVGNDYFSVILGDNIFDNSMFEKITLTTNQDEAYVFLKKVSDPQRFGVPEIKDGKIVKIEEKPKEPKSSFAVTGLYCYPSEVFGFIDTLKPSARGEKEITDVNNYFIQENKLNFVELDGFWSDAGTFESLLSSAIWAKNLPYTIE